MTTKSSDLLARAQRLGLWGLCQRWDQWGLEPWVEFLLAAEEEQRHQRSLDRRIHNAHLGSFHPMDVYDWAWPRKIDRAQIDDIFTFGFIKEAENILLLGPNGVGKTMIAQNIAYQGLLRGFTVLFTSASTLLTDLAERDTAWARQQRLRRIE